MPYGRTEDVTGPRARFFTDQMVVNGPTIEGATYVRKRRDKVVAPQQSVRGRDSSCWVTH